ncbi:MAG: ABC transporter permease [Bryobacteraceae bacterium]|nr:ABC transporter permease [Bryobacteraceae bacterium]
MNWRTVAEIVRKEFRQALRDPRMRTVLFLPPLVQLVIFGYAVNLDVRRARIGWMDQDRTPASRELRAAFAGSPYFELAPVETDDQERDLLDRGAVTAVVRVLPGFARDVARGRTASVQVVVDGSNSNTAAVVAGYAGRVIAAYGRRVMLEQQEARLVARTAAAGGPVHLGVPALEVRPRVWFNEDLLSRNYFVPGVVVNIITLVTLMLTAMAIVREKEIGTMEQLMVTPVRPAELMAGKTLPFALVGIADVFLVTGAALLIFGVPFRGSGAVLLAGALLFLLTTLGMGLLISTISETQQQAMISSFFFFTPAFMLSGFTFPVRNMPEPVQYLTYLNPVRYFLEIVRGVFLKGTGAEALWPQMLGLAVLGLTILTVSILRFHKRLD